MHVTSIDHIAIRVADVLATRQFYERVLGIASREDRPGKWSLQVGHNVISLQDVRGTILPFDTGTVPGSGNFCLLTDVPMDQVVAHLKREGVTIVEGPSNRAGATGQLLSVYFKDPDGNLVEVSNQVG